MGLKKRAGNGALGAFIALAIVGLLGTCAYMAMYAEINCPWQNYQYGRIGALGGLVYAICVLSIIALCVYAVAVFFICCKCCKCLKCLSKVMMVIGTVIWFACFICECIFLSWNSWDLEEQYQKDVASEDFQNYAKAFKTKYWPSYGLKPVPGHVEGPSAFFRVVFEPSLLLNLQHEGPTFGRGEAVLDDGSRETSYLPVCYFESEAKKEAFEPVACSGKWDGEKLKNFMEAQQKLEEDARKWDMDNNRRAIFHLFLNHYVMYTKGGAYGIFPIIFGVQICAVVCGIVYVIIKWIACCCGCCCGGGKVGAEP